MSDRKNTVKAYNKEDMCEEVKHYLETEHNVHWIKDEAVCRIVHFVYHGGIWDEDYRNRFPALKRKHIDHLSEAEVLSYLTMIICTDRTQEGCIDAHIQNGKLEALLRRWLELYEKEKKHAANG